MHCPKIAWNVTCRAHNAYNPATALWAAFGTSARPRRQPQQTQLQNDSLISIWELDRAHALHLSKEDTSHSSSNAGTTKDALSSPIGESESRTLGEKETHDRREPVTEKRHRTFGFRELAPSRCKAEMLKLREWATQLYTPGLKRPWHQNPDLDYEGGAVFPAQLNSMWSHPPWAVPFSSKTSPHTVLDMEIARFVAWLEPTTDEKAARAIVGAQFKKFVLRALRAKNYEFRSTVLEPFGSECTGLALPGSDIDFHLFDSRFVPRASHNTDRPLKRMKAIFEELEQSPMYICVTLRNAKYPIINCQHKASGIDIQLVCSPSTKPQEKLTARYLEEIPNLRALYMLFKTFFDMRGLVDVFNGGIGSYGLFIMLVAALKRQASSSAPDTDNTLVSQLLYIVESYACLDTTRYAVAVHPRTRFLKHTQPPGLTKRYVAAATKRGDAIRSAQWAIGKTRRLQPYLLCLQDPANPLNDLGRKSNAIKHILTTLQYYHLRMKRDFHAYSNDEDGKSPERGTRAREDGLLVLLLGPCHEVYEARRKRMEQYGLNASMARAGNGNEEAGARLGPAAPQREESPRKKRPLVRKIK